MKRGQMTMLGIMIGVMVIIATVALIEPIKDQVTLARGAAGLDCGAAGLSTGEEGACIVVDWVLAVFIGVCFAVAVSYVGLKSVRQGG